MVSAQHTVATNRCLCRIINITDALRSNLFDTSFPIANLYQTWYAIMRFTPSVDVTKEFAISAQNVSAAGTMTIAGTALAATGGVPALITAVDVGPQSI
jgi:hypothetical protein